MTEQPFIDLTLLTEQINCKQSLTVTKQAEKISCRLNY